MNNLNTVCFLSFGVEFAPFYDLQVSSEALHYPPLYQQAQVLLVPLPNFWVLR